jgi:S1-C subfamily serine protease
LKVGDVILKIGDVEIGDKDGFSEQLVKLGAGQTIEVTLLRDGNEQQVEVELGER